MNKISVGQKITSLRQAHQLSVEELANMCACEPSEILELEASEVVPSLAPLIMITRALDVRLGTLLDDDKDLGPVFVKAGAEQAENAQQTLETSSDAGLLTFFSLAEGKAARHMDPFIITIDPSHEVVHQVESHEGEEFIYALEGPIEIQYGKELYVLQPGDSIYYDSIVPHEVRAHNDEWARFLAVVYTL